ncbi:DUF1127 domain-containing protein [Bradyrhizobium sp. dw_78]|uniref:DUF1127 domain-containing protein n=1 Tax=Bradyrhizobium sp. dw_78 TaxID=2719793 RepID=UPI00201C6039|nr:DUF1127 domain-containing protein [Bradyrhizobium sp. dw_78]
MSIQPHHRMINHHDTGLLALLGEALHQWRERRRQRRELTHWTERDLHDVGLSWSDLVRETGKPFWRG